MTKCKIQLLADILHICTLLRTVPRPAKTDKRQFTVIEIEVMSKLYGYRYLYIHKQTHHAQHILYHVWVIEECGIDASSMYIYLVYYIMLQICISIDYLIIIQVYYKGKKSIFQVTLPFLIIINLDVTYCILYSIYPRDIVIVLFISILTITAEIVYFCHGLGG
jgi:hypothetical protein